MTSNVTEKLNTFSSLVMQDAQEKRDKIIKETEKEYKECLDKKETELLKGAYEDIQKNIRTVRREANEKVLHSELDAKKKLIMKRESIIESVMDEAREKLKEFTKSDKYETWLTDKVKKAIFELGEGKKIVSISADDFRMKEKLESLSGDITVEASAERDFIGGAKITNVDRRIAADYSLSELVSEQKAKFLRESGLSLD